MMRTLTFTILWITCSASDFYHQTNYSTVSGIAAYRSALTLDWLADEDSRQREYAHAYEKDNPVLSPELENSQCMEYSRPAAGKVARLMLELLKNLEGEDDLILELGRVLVRANLLLRTTQLESEPDLSALVQTPQLMQGEPHVTLPRVLSVAWILASDRHITKENGWCTIEKLTEYLDSATPPEIAVHMRLVDPMLSRARYILEDFVQSVTPLNIGRQLQPVELKTKMKKKYHHNAAKFTEIRRLVQMPTRTELVTTTVKRHPDTTLNTMPDTTSKVIAEKNELVSLRTSNSGTVVVACTRVLVLCTFVI